MQLKPINQSVVKKDLLALPKPSFIRCIEIQQDNNKNYYGCFQFGPLKSNQTITISNTLRRILLSNISGIGITYVYFNNRFLNEFSTLSNFRESVLEILVNLSQIDFYPDIPFSGPQVIRFQPTKLGKIYAKDIQLPPFVYISNPHHYIAEMVVEEKNFDCRLVIERGKGYLSKSENLSQFHHRFRNKGGCILPLNTSFSPIKRVNFRIEDHLNSLQNKRDPKDSHHRTERIIFEIWTKKSLHPVEALRLGVNEIIDTFTDLQEYIPEPQNCNRGMTANWLNDNIYKYLQVLKIRLGGNNTHFRKLSLVNLTLNGTANGSSQMQLAKASLRQSRKGKAFAKQKASLRQSGNTKGLLHKNVGSVNVLSKTSTLEKKPVSKAEANHIKATKAIRQSGSNNLKSKPSNEKSAKLFPMPMKRITRKSKAGTAKKKVPVALIYYQKFSVKLKQKVNYSKFTKVEKKNFSNKIFKLISNANLQLSINTREQIIDLKQLQKEKDFRIKLKKFRRKFLNVRLYRSGASAPKTFSLPQPTGAAAKTKPNLYTFSETKGAKPSTLAEPTLLRSKPLGSVSNRTRFDLKLRFGKAERNQILAWEQSTRLPRGFFSVKRKGQSQKHPNSIRLCRSEALLKEEKHLQLLLPAFAYEAVCQAEISSFEELFQIPRKKLLRIKGLGGRKGIIETRRHMKPKLGYFLRSRTEKKKREMREKMTMK